MAATEPCSDSSQLTESDELQIIRPFPTRAATRLAEQHKNADARRDNPANADTAGNPPAHSEARPAFPRDVGHSPALRAIGLCSEYRHSVRSERRTACIRPVED